MRAVFMTFSGNRVIFKSCLITGQIKQHVTSQSLTDPAQPSEVTASLSGLKVGPPLASVLQVQFGQYPGMQFLLSMILSWEE